MWQEIGKNHITPDLIYNLRDTPTYKKGNKSPLHPTALTDNKLLSPMKTHPNWVLHDGDSSSFEPRTNCPSLWRSAVISYGKLPCDLIVYRQGRRGLSWGLRWMVWWGMPANVQACWRQGGVLITGCMHFVKCRAINHGNYTPTTTTTHPTLKTPIPQCCFIPSLLFSSHKHFPSGVVAALSHGN